MYALDVEADELWSFVGNKDNKQWVWIALDVATRQVIAFHVGSRDREAARELWKKIPDRYQEKATFYTDLYESYVGVILQSRHRRVTKQCGLTNHIERFNCTLRQFQDLSVTPWLSPKNLKIISAQLPILSATIIWLKTLWHYWFNTTPKEGMVDTTNAYSAALMMLRCANRAIGL